MFTKTINTNEAKTILANTQSTQAEKHLANYILAIDGKDNTEAEAVAVAMNKKSLAEAVTTLWNGDSFNWENLIDGTKYLFINTEADTDVEAITEKTVLVRDVFCKKLTKTTKKHLIDPLLYAMVTTLGNNMGIAFANDHKDVVSMLKVYTKFTDAPKCFFGENASSNNAMEKQFQLIMDTMLTAEKAPKAKKMYVTHTKDTFIRANKDGYKNGNEITLLQILVDHIADCKNGKKYNYVSKLDGHKEIKEKDNK